MKSSVRIVAHRAQGFNLPENSLPAVVAALQSGVDEVEIDARRCSDAVLVVNHSQFLASSFIPTKRLQHTTSLIATGNGLPLLSKVLLEAQPYLSDKKLRIELKDPYFPEDLITQIIDLALTERIVITAWSLELLRSIHVKFPLIQLCLSVVEGFSLEVRKKDLSFLDSVCIVPTFSRFLPVSKFQLRDLAPLIYVVPHSNVTAVQLLEADWCSGVFSKEPTSLLRHRDLE